MLSPFVFRAYDIRGEYGTDLDEEGMIRIGKALGSFMRKRNMRGALVGGDTRQSTPALRTALIEALKSTGVYVKLCPQNSFGVTIFTAQREQVDCCFYVTASHLPPNHNGVKPFYGNGLSFVSDEIFRVGKIAEREKFVTDEGKQLMDANLTNEYIEFMKEQFDCSGIKTVLDCAGASTSLIAPKLFKEIGLKTREVFCEVDPALSVRDLRPSTETLGELIKTVKEHRVDFGVGFDGDGDRAVIVDEQGNVLLPDQVAVMIGKQIMKKGDTIVATVECSMLPDKVLKPKGIKVIRVPVGHSFIMQAGHDYNAAIGYEATGHMCMPSLSLSDDAMFMVLKVAETIKKTGKPLSKLIDELPKVYRQRIMFDTTEAKKFKIVEEIKTDVIKLYDNVTTIDGIRVDKRHGWALIRPSNTSPTIRLTVEAESQGELGKMREEFMGLMNKYCHEYYETSF